MPAPPFTRLVAGLEASNPFVGPEAIERTTGHRFRARVGANESAFGISPRARAAAARAVERLHWYADPENYELRADLAAVHGVAVEEILVAAGIDDLLALVIRAFALGGGRAVMPLGSYPTFAFHAATLGAPLDTVRYGTDDHVDLDALARQAGRSEQERSGVSPDSGATLVYLANPDNPSGTWHPVERLRRFLGALPRRCILALDEAYLEFAPGGAPAAPTFAGDPRVVHLRTFSKAHGMAGARVGYAICAAAVAAGLDQLRLQFGVNRVAQEAARAALADGAFVAAVARQVAEGRTAYLELARTLEVPALPSATNFVCLDFGTRQRADAVMAALIGRGVFVRKPPAPPLDRCVRLTIGTPAERAVLAEELTRVLERRPRHGPGTAP